MRLLVCLDGWALARGLGLSLLASLPVAWAQAPSAAQATAPALTASAPSAAKPRAGCLVAQFKALSLKQNDPARRAHEAEDWLKKYVALCSPEQLTALYGNSPAWLGPALTQEISSFLEGAIEARALGNPKLMGELYDSLGKSRPSGTVVMESGMARAPVVQAPMNPAALAGSVNYGNIGGSTSQNINVMDSPGALVGQSNTAINKNKSIDAPPGLPPGSKPGSFR